MRLKITKSKNAQSLYVIRSTYENGKHSSKIVEKLATYAELSNIHNDPIAWAKQYIRQLNDKEKEATRKVLLQFSQDKSIPKDFQKSFNIGYLFLQYIYYMLGLHKLTANISSKYKIAYDFDSILSRLIYSRIIFPASKLSTFSESKKFLEQPDFQLQHVYRALDIIAKEDSYLQSELYKNSCTLSKRNDSILFYDCTNFFFESESQSGIRQYGCSKEHRPSPIVEMGLFMDGDGIPLAFSIFEGNKNEQQSLIPLEQQIIKDFAHSKFVVCTDAGLSSFQNRCFNNKANRAFITTQSIKKLKSYLKEWCLDTHGWYAEGFNNDFDISSLQNDETLIEKYKNTIFFKERWINENGLEQKLIVTFSLKYKFYQQNIRKSQVDRAKQIIANGPSKLKSNNPNDCKRFITKTSITPDGEIAKKTNLSLNEDRIENEAKYDGFYAVCTNLDESACRIADINRNRWEIEECFRIMKTDFEARPVYLQNDERIKAHFMTCFLSLIIFRYLEKKLNYKYTSSEIIKTLRSMNLTEVGHEGFIPSYTRTDITDHLHEVFSFRTDYEILSKQTMKKILKLTKDPIKSTHN